MCKNNFIISNANIRAVTQQLLIYLAGYYNSHDHLNNFLQEGDVIAIKGKDLYVLAKDNVPKLKLELDTPERKLYNYVQGPSLTNVDEDAIVQCYAAVINAYIKSASTSPGVDTDNLESAIRKFNETYDLWKYSLHVVFQTLILERDVINTLRLSTEFININVIKVYCYNTTVFLTPECLYIVNDKDYKSGWRIAHANSPFNRTLHMVSKIFNIVNGVGKTDLFENLTNPFVNLTKLLNIFDEDVPIVITEYNTENYRSVVCVNKKNDICLLQIGNSVCTSYGEDLGEYTFATANDEQRKEWLKLLRKNPQIDLSVKLE